MKNLIYFLILISLNSIIIGNSKKYNILIISLCSVSREHLSVYGYKRNTDPNLKKFSKNSFIFKNAYTKKAWSNIKGYIGVKNNPKWIKENGYRTIKKSYEMLKEEELFNDQMYKPGDSSPDFFISFRNIDKTTPKYFKKRYEHIKKELTKNTNKPFFLEIHIKLQHFPYCGENRKYYNYKKFFTESSKNMVDSYFNINNKNNITFNIKDHFNSLPMYGALFKYIPGISNIFPVNKNYRKGRFWNRIVPFRNSFGFLWNKKILAKWRNSLNYRNELQLIKDCYDSKLSYLDNNLRKLLFLFNNKELQKNTVVIFMGDHGESFMQHGFLIHGATTYDEEISIPLIIKIPGINKEKYIDDQIFEGSVVKIIKGIMNNKINKTNFIDHVKENIKDNIIYSHNLMHTIYSIRYKNKWKYIYNINTEIEELYNIEKDKFEKNNINDQYLNRSAYFKELILDKITASFD